MNKSLPKPPVYPKPYPKFGFESTWRWKNSALQDEIDAQIHYPYPDTTMLTNNRKFMSEYNKLSQWQPISNDPHNFELQTIEVKDKKLLILEFKKLSKLMNKFDCIESSRSHNNQLEGGGHIHVDYGAMFGNLGYGNDYSYHDYLNEIASMKKPIWRHEELELFGSLRQNFNYSKYNKDKEYINNLFADFMWNLFAFISNNPWIPWAFNAPNDNDTAKSPLLNLSGLANDLCDIRTRGLQRTKDFTSDHKEYAIVLRQELQTFEFRFFGMPKNEKELLLHIDLAHAIFKHCFELTMKGIKLKLRYSPHELMGISYRKALNELKKVCSQLKIPFSKVEKHGKVNNLIIRYAYQKAAFDSGAFLSMNSDENMFN